jgi:hypothetical protein
MWLIWNSQASPAMGVQAGQSQYYPSGPYPGGGYSGDDGPASAAQLNNPQGVAVDAEGNLYISDYGNYRIRKVSPNGTITTIAGNGSKDHSGDGGPATDAQLNAPRGIAIDGFGNIYVADFRQCADVCSLSRGSVRPKRAFLHACNLQCPVNYRVGPFVWVPGM